MSATKLFNNMVIPEPPKTFEQIALQNALQNNDFTDLLASSICTNKLFILITIYTVLQKTLGDSPATEQAKQCLVTYVPDIVETKTKKLDETRAVRTALLTEQDGGLDTLLKDPRIPQKLNIAITTYQTLKKTDGLPESVVAYAYNVLLSWGRKGIIKTLHHKPRTPQPPHTIEFDGNQYQNLTAALRAAGYSKDQANPKLWNRTWNDVMKQIKVTGSATFDGKVFTHHLKK